MILTIVILSVIVFFLTYSTYNLLRKVENYEESVEHSDELFNTLTTDIQKVLVDIRKIDHSGIFEGDDEVGQTFKQLLQIIEGLEKL